MIKWFKSSDAAGIGMWIAYFVAFAFFYWASAALAGGGLEPGMQQQAIEILTPEDDWTDYLEWIVPGVITPIVLFYAGYKINKRRK